MNAEEILKAIKEMSNGERIKLLEQLYYMYYDKEISLEEMQEELDRDSWGDE